MSSSAMNMPTHITANGTTLGAAGCGWRGHRPSLRRGTGVDADRGRQPGAQQPQVPSPSSTAMRTGTRCTILVKLPVAFCGGMTLNIAPVAGARLSTRPVNLRPGSTSATTLAGSPGTHPRQLVFLEIGVDPQPVRGDDRQQRRAGSRICTYLGARGRRHSRRSASGSWCSRDRAGRCADRPAPGRGSPWFRRSRCRARRVAGGRPRGRPRRIEPPPAPCGRRQRLSGRSATNRRWRPREHGSGQRPRGRNRLPLSSAIRSASAWSIIDCCSAYFARRLASAAVWC